MSIKTQYTVAWETGCQPEVFEISAAICKQSQPLVVEFFVIILIINNKRTVEIFDCPEQEVLSIYQVSKTPEKSYLQNIALDFSLYKLFLKIPVWVVIFL